MLQTILNFFKLTKKYGKYVGSQIWQTLWLKNFATILAKKFGHSFGKKIWQLFTQNFVPYLAQKYGQNLVNNLAHWSKLSGFS